MKARLILLPIFIFTCYSLSYSQDYYSSGYTLYNVNQIVTIKRIDQVDFELLFSNGEKLKINSGHVNFGSLAEIINTHVGDYFNDPMPE